MNSVEFRSFLQEVKYLILFFVLLDPLTTYVAISGGQGYEGNILLSFLLSSMGVASLLLLKVLFLIPVYCTYLTCHQADHARIWKATNYTVALFGVSLVVNNLLVIAGLPGLYQGVSL